MPTHTCQLYFKVITILRYRTIGIGWLAILKNPRVMCLLMSKILGTVFTLKYADLIPAIAKEFHSTILARLTLP
jgi:hypothetical protein